MTHPAVCISKILRVALDRALNRLSQTIRCTFVLFAELGLSYREIAETQERSDRHGHEPHSCRS